MGWLFCEPTKEALILHLERGFNDQCRLVDHKVVGAAFWAVIECTKEGSLSWRPGDRTIFLALMQGRKDGTHYAWGYKDMDECSGPYRIDCPIGLLNQAGPDDALHLNDNARRWRAAVRSRAARKRMAPKPEVGKVVEYGGRQYKLLGPLYNPRRGWNVEQVEDGRHYRMKVHQLHTALRQTQQGATA